METDRYLEAIELEIGSLSENLLKCADCYAGLAKSGHSDASVRLGVLVEEHPAILRQFQPPNYWYSNAARLGHPRGYYNQGRILYENQQFLEALSNFETGISLGDSTSLVFVGTYHEYGYTVSIDLSKAFACYRTAALRGEVDGAIRLSLLAQHQTLSETEINWVFHCLEIYRRQSNPIAAYELAVLLLNQISPSEEAVMHPLELMELAANGGHSGAEDWLREFEKQ